MDLKSFLRVALLASFFISCQASKEIKLPPPERKYNILMLLAFGSPSHRNCFLPLAEALANRGHKIVILSGLPPVSKNPNVKEINHGIDMMSGIKSMFEVREKDPTKGFKTFETNLPKLAREIYDVPAVKDLYEKRDEFDIMIIDELFNEPAYPFLEGRRFITISTPGILPPSSAILGNVLNPSYVPSIMRSSSNPFSFIVRVENLFDHLFLPYFWRHKSIFPLIHKELSAKFPSLPALGDIEKNISLVLSNSHFSMEFPMPILPSQVEVGGMHCKPGKPLPKELASFIDDSGPEGVIYFSLGSVCKSSTMPEKYKKIMLEAFGKLKQKVIWKFEEDFPGLSKNIMVQKWLPQQDILAHPKVKLFITHGGLLSMQEAVFHATPLLALPVFGDQERNSERIRNRGFGDYLLWEDMTVDSLTAAINKLIENPKYKRNIEMTSLFFRDQPSLPLERAVWWTEYVLRHKGAPQLKSPAADLSWIEYLMIDVILALHICIILLYWLLKKSFGMVTNMLCKSKSKAKSKKE